jgi:hypothetical protein
MVSRVLHYVSIVCCLFVTISFALFALAQVSHASSHQAGEIAPASQRATAPRSVPPSHTAGQPRRFIDGVAHKLTSPFDSIVGSGDAWVSRGIPALFALLVYGAGLGFLSRWADGRAAGPPEPTAGSYV